MYVLLLYNPKAGAQNFGDYLDYIVQKFQEKDQIIVPYPMLVFEKTKAFLKRLDFSRIEKILISGGDGTIHQVINELIALDIDKPIGIFPTGTANDFSQFFHIPKDIEGMVAVAANGKTQRCDVGRANDKYFINVASFGNLVDISQRVNEQVKSFLGVLAYYIKGIEEIPKLKAFEAEISTSDYAFKGDIYFALVMNGRSAGGFRKLAPLSEMSDGLLDLVVFKKCPILELMPLLVQVCNGEHPKSDYIDYLQSDRVHIHCNEKIVSDLDGEAGPVLPLDIEVLKQRLEIIKA